MKEPLSPMFERMIERHPHIYIMTPLPKMAPHIYVDALTGLCETLRLYQQEVERNFFLTRCNARAYYLVLYKIQNGYTSTG
jgi:hypothetical protein